MKKFFVLFLLLDMLAVPIIIDCKYSLSTVFLNVFKFFWTHIHGNLCKKIRSAKQTHLQMCVLVASTNFMPFSFILQKVLQSVKKDWHLVGATDPRPLLIKLPVKKSICIGVSWYNKQMAPQQDTCHNPLQPSTVLPCQSVENCLDRSESEFFWYHFCCHLTVR